jgi:hypothetical protein
MVTAATLVALLAVQTLYLGVVRDAPVPKAVEEVASRVLMPVEPRLAPGVVRDGSDVRIAWGAWGGGATRVFYRVLRARPTDVDPISTLPAKDGVRCSTTLRGAPTCVLIMTPLGVTHEREWVDRPPPGEWVYRVALSANWKDDPLLGDMLVLSPPVRVTVPTSLS